MGFIDQVVGKRTGHDPAECVERFGGLGLESGFGHDGAVEGSWIDRRHVNAVLVFIHQHAKRESEGRPRAMA
jgi:hypothetical protein